MEGIVLAGVHAWGECVLESLLCRPLFPVAGFPLIGHTLGWLRDGGVENVRVCANGDTLALRRRLGGGDSLGVTLHYFEDQMPRGPAGCTRDAALHSAADTFVVVEGTVLPEVNLTELLAAHRGSQAVLTVVVADAEPARRGCELRQERLEPAGVYLISRTALEHVPTTGYQDIKEALIPQLYAAGRRVATYLVGSTATPRVTNAASYMAVCKLAVERLTAGQSSLPGYVQIGRALIHESARLHATARFIGPSLIGPQCHIEEDALVIGPTSMDAGCHIERQAVVSRCVLWRSCRVGTRSVLDHCILADGAEMDERTVMRETVCLARPSRWMWLDRVRNALGRGQARSRPASVPASCPAAPAGSSSKLPTVVATADSPPVGLSMVTSGAAEGNQ